MYISNMFKKMFAIPLFFISIKMLTLFNINLFLPRCKQQ